MPPPSPIWKLYYSDGTKFKNDKSHKNAWCLGCLLTEIRKPGEDGSEPPVVPVLVFLEKNGWLAQKRTASEAIPPICGKVSSTLVVHARDCRNLDNDAIGTDIRNVVLAELNADKENVPPALIPSQIPVTPSRTVSWATLSRTPSSASTVLQPIEELHPRKRQKILGYHTSPPSGDPIQDQAEFELDILQLFCDNKIAFRIADSTTMKAFFKKWLPYLRLPSRRVLSGRLLKKEVDMIANDTRIDVEGCLATGQCDGWKNVAKTNVVTSMMTVDQKEYPVRSHNMFGEPKTGDRLLELVEEDLEFIKRIFGVIIIAWCTDNGPDGKKMRRLLKAKYPWIIVLVCWAHQINLVVGDILGLRSSLLRVISQALDIVRFFNDHGKPLALLREEQMITYNGRYWSLMLPAATRWLSNYLAIERVLRIKTALQSCRIRWEEELVAAAGTEDLRAKARETLCHIGNDQFWNDLESVRRILEPLSIANNITQAPNLRMDHVLVTLGNLYRIYSCSENLDPVIRAKTLDSLERRWKAADQDVFILATFLNPYIRHDLFSPAALSNANLYEMAIRVHKRLMQSEPTNQLKFLSDFDDYYSRKNGADLSPERMLLSELQKLYEEAGEPVDIVAIWARIRKPDSELANLAIRLLSVVANSTACERTFSDFGSTHTKSRNKLGVEKVHDITTVRQSIRRHHKEAGLVENRKKRKLGEVDDASNTTAATTETIIDSEPLVTCTEPASFEETAQILISEAREEELEDARDEEEVEDEELPETVSLLAAFPAHGPSSSATRATSSRSGGRRRTRQAAPANPSIPLATLFTYPTQATTTNNPAQMNPSEIRTSTAPRARANLDIFWRGGLLNLKELVDSHDRESQQEQDG